MPITPKYLCPFPKNDILSHKQVELLTSLDLTLLQLFINHPYSSFTK